MSIKGKLKRRLLEIPVNNTRDRELHYLSEYLNEDLDKVEFYLNELVSLNILKKKNKYMCHSCCCIETISKDDLEEIIIDNEFFECSNCFEFVSVKKDTTRYVYFDIKDIKKLENW